MNLPKEIEKILYDFFPPRFSQEEIEVRQVFPQAYKDPDTNRIWRTSYQFSQDYGKGLGTGWASARRHPDVIAGLEKRFDPEVRFMCKCGKPLRRRPVEWNSIGHKYEHVSNSSIFCDVSKGFAEVAESTGEISA